MDFFRTHYGPTLRAFEALDPAPRGGPADRPARPGPEVRPQRRHRADRHHRRLPGDRDCSEVIPTGDPGGGNDPTESTREHSHGFDETRSRPPPEVLWGRRPRGVLSGLRRSPSCSPRGASAPGRRTYPRPVPVDDRRVLKAGARLNMKEQFVEGEYASILWTAETSRERVRIGHRHLRHPRRQDCGPVVHGEVTPRSDGAGMSWAARPGHPVIRRSTRRTRPEPGPHVAPVGRVEVSPCVPQQPRPRRPAAAAQHLVRRRTTARVLLVRVGARSRGTARSRSPSTPRRCRSSGGSRRAVPRRASAPRRSSPGRGRRGSPASASAARRPRGSGASARTVAAAAARLPLGLGRQPAAGPAAVRLGLVPVDVDHRPVRLQRHPAVEVARAASRPRRAASTPGARPPAASRQAQPGVGPQLAAAVAAVLDERGELGLGHRRARDGERRAARPGGPTSRCRRRTARPARRRAGTCRRGPRRRRAAGPPPRSRERAGPTRAARG